MWQWILETLFVNKSQGHHFWSWFHEWGATSAKCLFPLLWQKNHYNNHKNEPQHHNSHSPWSIFVFSICLLKTVAFVSAIFMLITECWKSHKSWYFSKLKYVTAEKLHTVIPRRHGSGPGNYHHQLKIPPLKKCSAIAAYHTGTSHHYYCGSYCQVQRYYSIMYVI